MFDQSATRFFGGGRASDELIEHYLPRLRAFVRARIGAPLRRRESESDVVQSVCRELFRGRDRLEFDREAEFRAWLFTAALNKIRHKGRHWGREKRAAKNEESVGENRSLEELTAAYSGVLSPSRIVQAHEQIDRIEAALDRLPEDHREVISLTRIAGLPYEDVARHLSRSITATRQLLGRALRSLAKELAV